MSAVGADDSITARDVHTVAIVDDHRAFADAVSLAINAQSDLRCIGTAATGEEALALFADNVPDVVLLDIHLPAMSGVEVLHVIKRRLPDTRVLLITGDTDNSTLLTAAQAGADGFVTKADPLEMVILAIRKPDEAVIANPPTLDRLKRRAAVIPAQAAGERGALTDRELEVLFWLSEGQPVKTIARTLGISVNTCRGYVQAILQKLSARSQLDAVVKAARRGLLPNIREPGH